MREVQAPFVVELFTQLDGPVERRSELRAAPGSGAMRPNLAVHQRGFTDIAIGDGDRARLLEDLDRFGVLPLLAQRLAEGDVQELIVATNPTVEGEATAHYLAQLARAHGVQPSRLAHGVPLGGELEYVDRGTLSHAFGSRSEIPDERIPRERSKEQGR